MTYKWCLPVGLMTLFFQTLTIAQIDQSGIPDQNPFVGAWQITQTITTDSGGSSTVNDSPEMGVYVFTDHHFSIMLIPGSEREPFYFREHSDAEKLKAYDNFSADAGTYTYDESTLYFQNMIAKIPDVMDFPGTHEWKMDGEEMIFVFSGAWAPPDSQVQYRLKRLE